MKKTMLMFLVCLVSARAYSDTFSFNGNTSGSVTNPANWTMWGGLNGNTVPQAGDTVILDGPEWQAGSLLPLEGTLYASYVVIVEVDCSLLDIVADIVIFSNSPGTGYSPLSISGNVVADLDVDFLVTGNFMGVSSVAGLGHLLADGTVTGSALFTGSTTNAGTVTADALFVDSAVNSGTVGTYHPKPDGGGGGGINGTGILGMF